MAAPINLILRASVFCLFASLLISGGRSKRERKILLKSNFSPLASRSFHQKTAGSSFVLRPGNEARPAHETRYDQPKVELVHDQSTLHTFVAPGDDENIGLQLPQHRLSLTTIHGLALMVPLSLELHALRSCL